MKKKPADPTPLPVNPLAKALTELVSDIETADGEESLRVVSSENYLAAKSALDSHKAPLVMPKDKTEGLRNFIAMAIKALDEGTPAEAKYLLVDLWNDIGSAYVIK